MSCHTKILATRWSQRVRQCSNVNTKKKVSARIQDHRERLTGYPREACSKEVENKDKTDILTEYQDVFTGLGCVPG